jgi:hypothetical protein
MLEPKRIRRRTTSAVDAGLVLLAGLILPFVLFALTASRIGRWPSLDPRLPVEFLVLLALASLAPLGGGRWPAVLRWLAAVLLLPIALCIWPTSKGRPCSGATSTLPPISAMCRR